MSINGIIDKSMRAFVVEKDGRPAPFGFTLQNSGSAYTVASGPLNKWNVVLMTSDGDPDKETPIVEEPEFGTPCFRLHRGQLTKLEKGYIPMKDRAMEQPDPPDMPAKLAPKLKEIIDVDWSLYIQKQMQLPGSTWRSAQEWSYGEGHLSDYRSVCSRGSLYRCMISNVRDAYPYTGSVSLIHPNGHYSYMWEGRWSGNCVK